MTNPLLRVDGLVKEFQMKAQRGGRRKRIVQAVSGVSFDVARGETLRSEERRVGKECRSRWSPYH